MTFNVIPILFLHFKMWRRITLTSGPPPPPPPPPPKKKKKLELLWRTFLMLIFLWVQKLVDVSHFRLSMLIFLRLVPHPLSFFLSFFQSLFFLGLGSRAIYDSKIYPKPRKRFNYEICCFNFKEEKSHNWKLKSNTVKPVCNSHPWDSKKVTVVQRVAAVQGLVQNSR